MEAALLTFPLFSPGEQPATAKYLVLGPAGAQPTDRFRSLNFEHVSAADLIRQEISRQSPPGHQARRALEQAQPVPDETFLAIVRRWFWSRKPDAGFVLTDFPATLLQAQVFDEWLDLRGETLTAALVLEPRSEHGSTAALIDYYRMQGVDLLDARHLAA